MNKNRITINKNSEAKHPTELSEAVRQKGKLNSGF